MTAPRTKRAQLLARVARWEEERAQATSARDRQSALKELDAAEKALEQYDQAVELHMVQDLAKRMRQQASAALADGSHVAAHRALVAAHELEQARELAKRRDDEAKAGKQGPVESILELSEELIRSLDQPTLLHLAELLARASGLAYRRGA